MKRELTARVGADGVLSLTLPLGPDDANKTVRVVVETMEQAAPGAAMTPEEWAQFVRSIAGRITDPTFERQPQGEYEQREQLR